MRAVLLIAIVACGNDRAPTNLLVDTPDSLPDTPAPPAGCDWAELNDPVNDITLGNGAAEITNLIVADALVICGRVDNGHLIGEVVDADAYEITLAGRTALRIDFAGVATGLAALDVAVVDAGNATVARGAYLGTHAVFETTLAAGAYRLVVTATNPADVAAGFDYKLRVTANPTRCARVTAIAAFVEINDGPQSDRNDMIEIRYATDERTLTAATNDDPEPSGVVTTAGTDVRITGTSDDVDGGDEFKDRDTYLIETGAHDELALRIDWTGDADFDAFLFPEDATTEIASATSVGKTAPEHAVFPVLPDTRYWLWVGSYDSSLGLPIDYDVTLCPTLFAPSI